MKYKGLTYTYTAYAFAFFFAPLLLILFYSLTADAAGRDFTFTLAHFARFFDFSHPQYMKVLVDSFRIALISTVICLLLGYPMAYVLANMKPRVRSFLSLLFVLPMWMNFLLRTYAWMSLLETNGLINMLLTAIGLPPITIMYTEKAVILGMVYNYLPFMILPIYNSLIKLDGSLLDSADDLGASPWQTFSKVTVPLTKPAIFSGINMVFMPSVTTFAISTLLGGSSTTLIGTLIENQFKVANDMGFGSAMSVIIMIFVFGTSALSGGSKDEEVGL
ncbi:MAG: ABC transporter permease [Clostridia bacterium]|nr:ABC transporter permease [Clostridia bacterium]